MKLKTTLLPRLKKEKQCVKRLSKCIASISLTVLSATSSRISIASFATGFGAPVEMASFNFAF